MSGKILDLEFWAKMLSTCLTASFFKMKYFKEEVSDKLYFWHANKHQGFLNVDTIILGVCNQTWPKYQK